MRTNFKKNKLIFVLTAFFVVLALGVFSAFFTSDVSASSVYAFTESTQTGKPPSSAVASSSQLVHTTPSAGDVRILFLVISFSDVGFAQNVMSEQEISAAIFGGEDSTNPAYPFESTSAYFRRASFGALRLSGDVFSYKARNINQYMENGVVAYNKLIEEAFASLDNTVDFSNYDSDGDAFIDGLVLSLPMTQNATPKGICTRPVIYSPSFPSLSPMAWDSVLPEMCLINFAQPLNTVEDHIYLNQSVCHLIGHSLGLPDYCETGVTDTANRDGLNGIAGHELMDDMTGDLSAFSKLILGWLPDNQIITFNIFSTENQTFSLVPINEQGANCLVIFNQTVPNGFLAEYLICEYITPTRNNQGLFETGGIRVMHVQAETSTTSNGEKEFLYSANGPGNTEDTGIRILKLVNDGNGFFTPNDVLSFGVENFGFYVGNTSSIEDPGLEITFGTMGREAQLSAQKLEEVYFRCLDSDGKTLISEGYCYKNRPLILPDAPDKTDERYEYEFVGWSDFEQGMIADETDMTFVAQYERHDRIFKYTFLDDDGRTVLKTGEGKFGDIFAAPQVQDKSDPGNIYTFLRFEGFFEGMTLSANVEFKAVYNVTPRTYTYTFLSKDGKRILKQETAAYGSTIYAPRGDMSFTGFQTGMKLTQDEIFIATGLEPETYAIFGAGAAILFVAAVMSTVLLLMHIKRRAKLRKDKNEKEKGHS